MVHMTPRTIRLHGHELSFVDSGSGPVLLFIHGILGSQRQWSRLVDGLDDDHRVLVPDLFGHGDSAKPLGDYSISAHAAALRDLLDQLGIGESHGSATARRGIACSSSTLPRASPLVLGPVGARAGPPRPESATLPVRQVLSVVASAPVLSKVEILGQVAAKVGWRPGSDLSAVWSGFTSLGDGESRRAFLATTRAVIDLGGQSISAHDHLLEAPPLPILIVWGSKDRMIPAWHALNAEKAVPDCRVELFDGRTLPPPRRPTGSPTCCASSSLGVGPRPTATA